MTSRIQKSPASKRFRGRAWDNGDLRGDGPWVRCAAAEVTNGMATDGRLMGNGSGRACTAWHKTDIEPCDYWIPVHDGTG